MPDIMIDINTVVEKIIRLTGKPDHIIALAKGGYIPARIIAQQLNVKRIYSYGINFYDENDKRMETPIVYQNVDMSSINKSDRILIVDDIVDSGLSLKWLYTSLEWQGYSKYESCALYVKPQAIIKPDVWAKVVDNDVWVQFAWE